MLLQERQANFTMNRSGELQGFLIWVEASLLPLGWQVHLGGVCSRLFRIMYTVLTCRD